MPKQKQSSFHNKPIVFTIIILILVAVLPIVLSYTNFYPAFLDKKTVYLLDSFVADIPLLPKTPKQVVTKALVRNQNLNSYSLMTSLDLETNKVKVVNFAINQAVENAGSNTARSKSKITGNISFFENGKIDIETIKMQNTLNFKITSLPSILGLNFRKENQGWYQSDLKAFQEGLSVQTRNDQQIIDDVRNSFQKIQSNLIDKAIFSKVTSFKTITINKERYYEIKFALTADSLNNLPMLSELKLKDPTLSLLVSSSSFYLTKIALKGEVDSGNQNTLETNSSLVLHLSSEVSNIGNSQNIEAPKKPTIIKNPIDLAETFTQTENKTAALITATSQSKDLGENFLTVERLISVILLLPKSI